MRHRLTDPLAPLELLAGQVAASIGLAIISQARGTRRTSLVIGSGFVIMFVLLLGYYLGQVFKLPFPLWLFQPIAAAIVLVAMTAAVLRFDKSPTPDRLDWSAGFIGLGLMLLPVMALLGWHDPTSTPGQLPIRIMSYNLHSGFDVTGRLNLEGIVQAIEAEQADVIGLQEVSRGWVLDELSGYADVVIAALEPAVRVGAHGRSVVGQCDLKPVSDSGGAVVCDA